jgi:hypothetical protein
MKRIFVYAVLALVGVFVTGRITLGESGAMRFLMKMESLMGEQKAEEVCAMFHDDLEFHVIDHTGGGSKDTTGNKQEFCRITREGVDALSKVPHHMNVELLDVKVKRDWMHPWTSEVSYVEKRGITIQGANITLNTETEGSIVLVQTLTGVKVRKVDAETFLAE